MQAILERLIPATKIYLEDNDDAILTADFLALNAEFEKLQQPTTGGLFDITTEIDRLKEIKDITDELHMVEDVLAQQSEAILLLDDLYMRDYLLSESTTKMLQNARYRKSTIKQLQKDTQQTYSAVTDLLDLKQKQANVSEARSGRQQAEQAGRQAEQAGKLAQETARQGTSIYASQFSLHDINHC